MASFTSKYKLPLNKTIETGKLDKKGRKEKERVQVGYALVPYPTLADFGITAEVNLKDEKPEIGDDGVPVLAKPELDFLQQAIIGEISAKVRNYFSSAIAATKIDDKGKLVGDLKELTIDSGKQLPQDFEMLTADSGRSGEALKIRREARADFEAYLAKQSKTQAVIVALGELFFNSGRVLGSASPAYVKALGQHSEAWSKQLSEAQTSRFTPKLVELMESINNAMEQDQLDLS